MGLFARRPLCLFCTLFLITSMMITSISFEGKLISCVFICGVILLLFVLIALFKRGRNIFGTVIFCLIALLIANLSSSFRIDYNNIQAKKMLGDREIIADITDIEYIAEGSAAYVVDIEEMSGNKTDIKALLLCDFGCQLDIGDRVIAYSHITEISDTAMGISGAEITRDKDIFLMAVIYEPSDGKVQRFNRELPFFQKVFAENGFSVVMDEITDTINERAYSFVGKEYGALLNGFLLGDTSDVSTETIRDFRRTGVSHLFAVSGLHISVLLGAVELLMRKFYLHKYIRCSVISVLAFILLLLTGFSMSALRSVLMLWCVYLAFLFSEDADPPTTLFVSITVIMLIYPYAVYELGMWMSFLATLGLVTVFPVIDKAVPKKKGKKRYTQALYFIGRSALMVAFMTIIANVFLLPIQWKIFGEISTVSVPTNILLAPLNAALLIMSVICLLFGGIPILGNIVNLSVRLICILVVKTVNFFSTLNMATVSLEYEFASVLVLLFVAAMVFVTVMKLKRKWIVAIPAVSFAVLFSIGILIFNATSSHSITYYGTKTNEVLSVTDSGKLCVVDMSNGSYDRLNAAFSDAAKYGAVDVDMLIFTSVGKGHISSMEYFFRSRIIKNIYIPTPNERSHYENALKLVELADNCGVNAYLYESTDVFELSDVSVLVSNIRQKDKNSVSVFVQGKEKMFGYTDAFFEASMANGLIEKCDTVLVGNNGMPDFFYEFNIKSEATLIYASRDLAYNSKVYTENINTYINPYDKVTVKFNFK